MQSRLCFHHLFSQSCSSCILLVLLKEKKKKKLSSSGCAMTDWIALTHSVLCVLEAWSSFLFLLHAHAVTGGIMITLQIAPLCQSLIGILFCTDIILLGWGWNESLSDLGISLKKKFKKKKEEACSRILSCLGQPFIWFASSERQVKPGAATLVHSVKLRQLANAYFKIKAFRIIHGHQCNCFAGLLFWQRAPIIVVEVTCTRKCVCGDCFSKA